MGDYMRKYIALSTVALGALLGPAMAADLAPIYKAPPAPVCFWCGWYAGVNVGAHWAQDTTVQTTGVAVGAAPTFGPEAAVAAGLATTGLGAKQSGFIGGGQVGYNWQAASWVYGAEADIQGLTRDVNGSVATVTSGVPGFPSEAFTSTTSVTKSLDYFGTLRARFGYLLTPGFLVYGTAGLAYGGVHATTSISQADAGILGGPPVVGYGSSASISQTRAGWTAGGGVEMQLGPRWTAKAEYLYYDLGSVSYGLPNLVGNAPPFAVPTWVASAQSTAKFNGDIVRLGLNYKF
jgi:outer membrane immunogenic protein